LYFSRAINKVKPLELDLSFIYNMNISHFYVMLIVFMTFDKYNSNVAIKVILNSL